MRIVPQLTIEDLSKQITDLTKLVAQLALEQAKHGDVSVRLLKPAQVAALFEYSKAKIYMLIDNGTLPSVRTDDEGTLRVPLVALQGWIAEKVKNGKFDPDSLSKLLSSDGSNDE